MNAAPVTPIEEASDVPRSGLLALRNAVALYFADNAVEATVTPVGLKYRSFIMNQSFPANANRVVFIPGEFDGDANKPLRRYGALDRSNRNHAQVRNPPELLSWERPFTISVWSPPKSGDTRNEGENLEPSEMLLEQVVRAVNDSGAADISWGNVTINASADTNFGVELLVSCSQRGPIFGRTLEIAYPKNGFSSDGVRISNDYP